MGAAVVVEALEVVVEPVESGAGALDVLWATDVVVALDVVVESTEPGVVDLELPAVTPEDCTVAVELVGEVTLGSLAMVGSVTELSPAGTDDEVLLLVVGFVVGGDPEHAAPNIVSATTAMAPLRQGLFIPRALHTMNGRQLHP